MRPAGGGSRGGRCGGSRGRSPRPVYRYVVRHSPGVAHSDKASPGSGSTEVGGRNSDASSVDGVTKKLSGVLTLDRPCGPNPVTHGVRNTSPNNGSSELLGNVSEAEIQTPEPLVACGVGRGYGNDFPSLPTHSNASRLRDQDEENQSASYSSSKLTHKKKEPSHNVDPGFVDIQAPREFEPRKCTSEGTDGKVEFEKSGFEENGFFSFDICEERNRNVPRLRRPLLETNRTIRSEMKRRAQGENIKVLRPGMILLKGYISLKDQVKLVKACRDLGRGHGGFYQPGYRDGAKLHLKMMCLGKNWDPETSMYDDDRRPVDDSKPPPIPDEFRQMVKGALENCHNYLVSQSKPRNILDILPSMSPNICIVNFYTKTGKLGLHQDKDESPESIRKGLPVVSFSLGDSAEFLFGDQKDIDKADKVVLESGDVLIFGGESRLIFHGVSIIKPETAPKALLEETDLRPGRLNLTFREY